MKSKKSLKGLQGVKGMTMGKWWVWGSTTGFKETPFVAVPNGVC